MNNRTEPTLEFDEQILWSSQPQQKHYLKSQRLKTVKPFLIIAGIIISLLILLLFAERTSPVIPIMSFILAIVSAVIIYDVYKYYNIRNNTYYYVSNKRVYHIFNTRKPVVRSQSIADIPKITNFSNKDNTEDLHIDHGMDSIQLLIDGKEPEEYNTMMDEPIVFIEILKEDKVRAIIMKQKK